MDSGSNASSKKKQQRPESRRRGSNGGDDRNTDRICLWTSGVLYEVKSSSGDSIVDDSGKSSVVVPRVKDSRGLMRQMFLEDVFILLVSERFFPGISC